jgi:hypothetical protein
MDDWIRALSARAAASSAPPAFTGAGTCMTLTKPSAIMAESVAFLTAARNGM